MPRAKELMTPRASLLWFPREMELSETRVTRLKESLVVISIPETALPSLNLLWFS